jgi:hypothetical protein
VNACATNDRWVAFVKDRLPKINDQQRDSPLGGEDAERASKYYFNSFCTVLCVDTNFFLFL